MKKMFVIELFEAEEKIFLGMFVSEEQSRPTVEHVSEIDGLTRTASLFTDEEVDSYRSALDCTGDLLTLKAPVVI